MSLLFIKARGTFPGVILRISGFSNPDILKALIEILIIIVLCQSKFGIKFSQFPFRQYFQGSKNIKGL